MKQLTKFKAVTQPQHKGILQTIFNLFTNQKNKKMTTEKTIPVVISSCSQPHVLQQRMKEERLTHGDRVKADLRPVRLESNFGKMVMYFCPMQWLEVREVLAHGDGGSLPDEAIIEGFEVPGNAEPGLYTLKNVELFSNGTMQVIATADTMFEAV